MKEDNSPPLSPLPCIDRRSNFVPALFHLSLNIFVTEVIVSVLYAGLGVNNLSFSDKQKETKFFFHQHWLWGWIGADSQLRRSKGRYP